MRQPHKSVLVSHPPHDRAHEHLDGPDGRILIRPVILPVCVQQPQRVLQLLLRRRRGHVDLIPEYQEGNVLQFVRREEGVELLLRLGESSAIDGVDEVDDAVHGREVILPQPTSRLVSAEVEGLQLQLSNDELVGVGMQSRDVGLDAVLLEHVEEGGLPGVVEAEEKDLRVLVVEAQRGEGVVEPVDKEHGWGGDSFMRSCE